MRWVIADVFYICSGVVAFKYSSDFAANVARRKRLFCVGGVFE